jgi:choline-glycine betaine transporter
MAAIMALIMCCIIVSANSGIDSGLPNRVAAAYLIAMPAAFVSVLIVRPLALRLTRLFVRLA